MTSFINLQASEVKDACQAYISNRKQVIAEMREPHILKEMAGGWFSKPKSREEAIKSLENNAAFSHPYREANVTGFYNAMVVFKILNLANIALQFEENGQVTLDAESAYILQPYLNGEKNGT